LVQTFRPFSQAAKAFEKWAGRAPFLSLPFSSFHLSPIPFPSFPSLLPLTFLSLPLPSLRSRPLNAARVSGERCKLPQWGLGQSPSRLSRQTIWCIFKPKEQLWLQQFLWILLKRNVTFCTQKHA